MRSSPSLLAKLNQYHEWSIRRVRQFAGDDRQVYRCVIKSRLAGRDRRGVYIEEGSNYLGVIRRCIARVESDRIAIEEWRHRD